MISDTLHTLIEINLVASLSILLILSVRLWFRRYFGARNAYRLWLILPITVLASQLPARQIVETKYAPAVVEKMVTQNAQAPMPQYSPAPAELKSKKKHVALIKVPTLKNTLTWIWVIGAILSFGYLVRRQHAYVAGLGTLRRDTINGFTVWYSARTDIEPALVGAFTPKLTLPADFDTRYTKDEQRLILAHERAHYVTGDTLINLGVAMTLCVCWFNPFLHLAATYLRRDQELACDAAVIAQYPQNRRLYAQTLVKSQTAQMAIPIGCAWPSFHKNALLGRVSNLNRQRRPQAYILGLSTVILLTGSGGALAWVTQSAERITRIESMRYSVTGVDIRSAAAMLTVIAEDRADVTLSYQENSQLQPPSLIVEDQRLIIDGGLPITGATCTEAYDGSPAISIPEIGSIGRQELLKLTLRVPRNIDLNIDGIVLTQIDGIVGGQIESTSCGKTTIGASENGLGLVQAGFGDMEVGSNSAQINVDHYGTGDVMLRNGQTANLNIFGSGNISAGSFDRDVSATLHSTGSLQIAEAGNAIFNLYDDGAVWAENITNTLTAQVTGDGALGVVSISGAQSNIRSEGTGDIWIQNADLDRLTTYVSGSGGLRFEGRADIVDAEFAVGGSDISVAAAGEVNTRRSSNATGVVLVGR